MGTYKHIVGSLVDLNPDASLKGKIDDVVIKDQIREAVAKSVLKHKELGELTLSKKTKIKMYICSPYGVVLDGNNYEIRVVCKVQLECGILCSNPTRTLYKCLSENIQITINNNGAIIASPIILE